MYYLRRFLELMIYPIRALLTSPSKLFSMGGRVLGISLPARLAVLVFFFLVICVILSFVAFMWAEDSSFSESLTRKPWHFSVIAALVVVIPIVVYNVLRLWLEGDASPFEDIENAWYEGLIELERQGLDLSEIPLFLILGSDGELREKALFEGSGLSLNVDGFPNKAGPLHFYGNPDGIYVVATEVGCLSQLNHIARKAVENGRVGPAPSVAPGGGIRGTIIPGAEGRQPDAEGGQPDELTQSEPSADGSARNPANENIRGTMEWAPSGSSGLNISSIGSPGAGGAGGSASIVALTPDESTLHQRRLEYLCRLIFRGRRPLCPLNGILVLLPFDLIERSDRESVALQKGLQRDMKTSMGVLKLRCPVTAAVMGMERESGFQELVRRVGRDRAHLQRFGKGFSLENPPIPERLEALAAHACGSFEAWVYTLFREKGSLAKPGNRKLYSLLCKIRRSIQPRLGNVLVSGFGLDTDQDPNAEAFLFGGCYFVAVGSTDDRQAFIKGVLDKLPEEESELHWTEEALWEDRKHRRLAHLIIGYDFLALMGLVGIIVYKLWFN